ncbi:hypothetical protein [Aquimarina sp. 2304DJ70-9]|uniref:hypothetical protein n=1 Tax=Aquimarina penaris TaxID=3231044 RepID=UPI00346198AE
MSYKVSGVERGLIVPKKTQKISNQDDAIWDYGQMEHHIDDLDVIEYKLNNKVVFDFRKVVSIIFHKSNYSTGNTGEALIEYMQQLKYIKKKKYLYIKNPKGKGGKPPYNGVGWEGDDIIKPLLNLKREPIGKIGPKRVKKDGVWRGNWRGIAKGYTNCSTAILEAISVFFGDGYGVINGVHIQDKKFELFMSTFQDRNWIDLFKTKYPELGMEVDHYFNAKRGDILSTGNHRLIITGKPYLHLKTIKNNNNKKTIIRKVAVPVIHASPPTNNKKAAVKEEVKYYSLYKAKKFKIGRFYDFSIARKTAKLP